MKTNRANPVNAIIFDLGGVLIDWNPEYVYLDVFEGDRKKMNAFFEEVCTVDWNENQDAGYPLAKATEDRVALFPQFEDLIRMYYGRWEEMLKGAIEESVVILNRLFEKKAYKIVALTNWSAETFPIALERFDFLHRFEGIVVSGEEKTRKPFEDIYQTTLKRFGLNPKHSLFIDDNLGNIEAANSLHIQTIHFKSPQQLETDLTAMGIL